MKQIIYQMLPRLWGEGKFSSVDSETLGYVRGLGADYIWYTGLIRHATGRPSDGSEADKVVKGDAGSPYAITDYYDVNPYLADDPEKRMEEFEAMLGRTREAGLKAIVDFVPNHVAREYSGRLTPPGQKRLGEDDDTSVHWSPDNDFYYYPGEGLVLPVPADGYREFPAKASGNCFSPAPGKDDWYETVRLNYCDFHTATWDKMFGIVRFWARKGVAGFRCDMVEMVPPEFFKWLIARIKAEFPDIVFIAEVYQREKYRFYAEEVGFDLLYDKCGLYDILRSCTETGRGASAITGNWQSLGGLQDRMLDFLENHDEQRIASDFFAGSAEGGYAALAVSLLFNGASFMLYAGQEIGERGMDAEGFSGLDGRTSIFDFCKVASLQRLYKQLHGKESLKPSELKVLSIYRSLLCTAGLGAFRTGKTYDLCFAQGNGFSKDSHFAFLRGDGLELWLSASNFQDSSCRMAVTVPAEALSFFGRSGTSMAFELEVPAKGFCIKKL